jgi:hypothetical protein
MSEMGFIDRMAFLSLQLFQIVKPYKYCTNRERCMIEIKGGREFSKKKGGKYFHSGYLFIKAIFIGMLLSVIFHKFIGFG